MNNESISIIMYAEQNWFNLNNDIVINEEYLCPIYKL